MYPPLILSMFFPLRLFLPIALSPSLVAITAFADINLLGEIAPLCCHEEVVLHETRNLMFS